MSKDRILDILLSSGQQIKPKLSITKLNLTESDITDIFWKLKYMPGRCLGSKSGNRKLYPDHMFIFNANIIVEPYGKVWHGDVDVTADAVILKDLANEIGSDLYILYENDARWGKEDSTTSQLINKARIIVKCDKNKQNK